MVNDQGHLENNDISHRDDQEFQADLSFTEEILSEEPLVVKKLLLMMKIWDFIVMGD